MGEIKVGEYVIGMDGKPKKVLGVFPQGKKKIYRVRFSDTHYADCCEEHLWSIRTPLATQHSRPFKTVALKDFKDNLRNKHNYKWCIPISEPVQFDNGFKPIIKPYLLGVLIGDGSLTGGRVVVTNASPHILEKITALVEGMDNIEVTPRWDDLGNTYNTSFTRIRQVGRNPLVEELERMGLNVTSYFKKIPEEYKYLPVEDRLELLRGLLDTDGYVAPDGSIRFSSSSKQLVEDVQWVAQSLGGVTRGVRYKKTNFGTDSWYTTINPAKGMEIVTKPFKAERVTKDRKYFPARMIHGVEFIGEEECQCISVEDQHYLTDNFIVTHNTTTALATAAELKARTLIIVPVYLALNWKREIEKFFPGKIVSVLKHSKEFYFPVDSDFVIVTYSFVHKADILFEWAQMVIIDEGQLLKNMESKRSEAVHRLIYENSISRVIILTGTPILNRVYELYSLLAIMHYDPRVIDPPFLKKFNTYVAFANHFSYLNERQVNVGNRRVTVREWSGSKNEDELKEILSKFMYRPPNAVTLPKQYEKIVPVDDIDCPELQEAFETFISDDSNSRIQPRIKAQAALIKAPLTAELQCDDYAVCNLELHDRGKYLLFRCYEQNLNKIIYDLLEVEDAHR